MNYSEYTSYLQQIGAKFQKTNYLVDKSIYERLYAVGDGITLQNPISSKRNLFKSSDKHFELLQIGTNYQHLKLPLFLFSVTNSIQGTEISVLGIAKSNPLVLLAKLLKPILLDHNQIKFKSSEVFQFQYSNQRISFGLFNPTYSLIKELGYRKLTSLVYCKVFITSTIAL